MLSQPAAEDVIAQPEQQPEKQETITATQYNAQVQEISKQLEQVIAASALGIDKTKLASLPVKTYLDQTVVPVLIEGLKAVSRERPPNPIEYLALFLLRESASSK